MRGVRVRGMAMWGMAMWGDVPVHAPARTSALRCQATRHLWIRVRGHHHTPTPITCELQRHARGINTQPRTQRLCPRRELPDRQHCRQRLCLFGNVVHADGQIHDDWGSWQRSQRHPPHEM